MAKESKKSKKTDRFQSRRKRRGKVNAGVASILATFNNTIITISDEEGNVLVQKSPPHVGFKGSRKSTAYAATRAAVAAGEEAQKKYGMKEIKIEIKGVGAGRNAAVKGIDSSGLRVTLLKDRTRVPHNGCRSRKRPRK